MVYYYKLIIFNNFFRMGNKICSCAKNYNLPGPDGDVNLVRKIV